MLSGDSNPTSESLAFWGRNVRTTADAPMPPDEALKLLKDGNARFIKGEPTATRTNEKMRQELVDMGTWDRHHTLPSLAVQIPGHLWRPSLMPCLVTSLCCAMLATPAPTPRAAWLAAWSSAPASWVPAWFWCLATPSAVPSMVPRTPTWRQRSLRPPVLSLPWRVCCWTWPQWRRRPWPTWVHTLMQMRSQPTLCAWTSSTLSTSCWSTAPHCGRRLRVARSRSRVASITWTLERWSSWDVLHSSPPFWAPTLGFLHPWLVRVAAPLAMALPHEVSMECAPLWTVQFQLRKLWRCWRLVTSALLWVLLWPSTPLSRCVKLWWAMGRHPTPLFWAVQIPACQLTLFSMPCQVTCLSWGRNAGNTCTHAEGSMVGSVEFCCGKLGSKLILVMGHTKCGAIAGATATYLASKEGKASKSAGSALEGLLVGLSGVAKQAEEELGVGADQDQLVSHSVRVNVFSSIEFLLKYSPSLRELVKSGNVEIQGSIYHLETGRVEFLGRSPRQAELLRSDPSLPPSLQALPIRTTTDGPLPSQEALKLLKEGNARFTSGAAISGKITPAMRKALVKEGQAPHTAIIGCADSRAPLETVFDAMPGDIFVLRNAGNTCTHAEGSVLGSLEFCVAALQSKMVLVLGHTACGAIKGATATYLQSKTGNKPQVEILQKIQLSPKEKMSDLVQTETSWELDLAHDHRVNISHLNWEEQSWTVERHGSRLMDLRPLELEHNIYYIYIYIHSIYIYIHWFYSWLHMIVNDSTCSTLS